MKKGIIRSILFYVLFGGGCFLAGVVALWLVQCLSGVVTVPAWLFDEQIPVLAKVGDLIVRYDKKTGDYCITQGLDFPIAERKDRKMDRY